MSLVFSRTILGTFMVGPFHSAIHLVSGVVGLLAATVEKYARWYLQIFGLVYAVLAALGFTIGVGNVNMVGRVGMIAMIMFLAARLYLMATV